MVAEFTVDVGGNVTHLQTGWSKTELGVASDHVVVYYDPESPEAAKRRIENTLRFHQFAKELKSGQIPARKSADVDLATTKAE